MLSDEELIERHHASNRIGALLLALLETCDLIAISDGAEDPIVMEGRKGSLGDHRYAVAFAKRDKTVMDFVQGDDLEALLDEVTARVS